MTEERSFRWWVKAVTPPILVLGAKTVLIRLGLMKPRPAAEEEASAEPSTELPEWEFVAEGWAREVRGWDAGGVADAYARKWPEFREAVAGSGPLGVVHETREGAPVLGDDPSAHNLVLSFGYVLGCAATAAGRDRLSVLDWGGSLGHYHVLGRALFQELELDWHVREVPTVAARGREVNPEVTFHEDDSCLERQYDLVFVSGALQYAVDWPQQLARLAGAARDLLYVTRLPIASNSESFVVLQRAQPYGYRTEYLGWVVSRDALLARAEDLDLELVRELVVDAWFSAEGAPESPIGHRGFLFRRA